MKKKSAKTPRAPSSYPRAFQEQAALLQERAGYLFRNKTHLYNALTHSSYTNENKGPRALPCNERLEFLGDSVLSVVVSKYLYGRLSDYPEGDLTKIRAATVCESALHGYAKTLALGQFLLLGNGEERTAGRERKSILADAFEAVIGAVFLDGGMAAATRFVLRFAAEKIDEILEGGSYKDYKSQLQQLVQVAKGELLEYALAREEGPAHERVFTVDVMLNSNKLGTGKGKTKREAEQEAARLALVLFGEAESSGSRG